MAIADIMGKVYSVANGTVIFLVILAFIILALIGFLYLKKKKAMNIPVIEIMDVGNGKTNIYYRKAGWFKKRMLLNIIGISGNLILQVEGKGMFAQMRKIYEVSSEDYHDINGVKGLIVARKSDDPEVLLPINTLELSEDSKAGMMEIAPADFRDVASRIFDDATDELKTSLEKYMPLIFIGVLFIAGIIIFYLISQTNNHTADVNLETTKITTETIKYMLSHSQDICSANGNFSGKAMDIITAGSNAP